MRSETISARMADVGHRRRNRIHDGFFGPGTEGFLIILFAHFLNMDFLRGSAEAKIINVSTNSAAIVYFALSVDVTWAVFLHGKRADTAHGLGGDRRSLRGPEVPRETFFCAALGRIGMSALA